MSFTWVCPEAKRPQDAQLYVDQLRQVAPAIGQAYTLSQAFLALVRERRGDELEVWMTAAMKSGSEALARFAQGLQEDLAAVTAGLLGRASRPVAAEPPPETTRLRVHHSLSLCLAPQYVAEELLRGEGFTEMVSRSSNSLRAWLAGVRSRTRYSKGFLWLSRLPPGRPKRSSLRDSRSPCRALEYFRFRDSRWSMLKVCSAILSSQLH